MLKSMKEAVADSTWGKGRARISEKDGGGGGGGGESNVHPLIRSPICGFDSN